MHHHDYDPTCAASTNVPFIPSESGHVVPFLRDRFAIAACCSTPWLRSSPPQTRYAARPRPPTLPRTTAPRLRAGRSVRTRRRPAWDRRSDSDSACRYLVKTMQVTEKPARLKMDYGDDPHNPIEVLILCVQLPAELQLTLCGGVFRSETTCGSACTDSRVILFL